MSIRSEGEGKIYVNQDFLIKLWLELDGMIDRLWLRDGHFTWILSLASLRIIAFFFCILILSIEGSKRLIIQQQNKQSKQQKYTNGSNERNQQHGRNDGHRHRWWPNKVQPLIKQYFDREIFGQEVFISLLDFFMIFGAMGSYLL